MPEYCISKGILWVLLGALNLISKLILQVGVMGSDEESAGRGGGGVGGGGGGRLKEKEESLSSACSVCGSPAAAHLHYGAVSCYSCRAFFRRGQPKQVR